MPTRSDITLAQGGSLLLIDGWLDVSEADSLVQSLIAETPWKQQAITIAGRSVMQPRLTAWYGDPGTAYVYSGLRNEPLTWSDTLAALRTRVSEAATSPFNSVLLNYYRDGHDSMGMHSDDEAALGRNPVIGSLSVGGARRFVLQHRRDKSDRRVIELTHGSLLIMRGRAQHVYKHGVPRQANALARVNLTFRRIVTGG